MKETLFLGYDCLPIANGEYTSLWFSAGKLLCTIIERNNGVLVNNITQNIIAMVMTSYNLSLTTNGLKVFFINLVLPDVLHKSFNNILHTFLLAN